MFVSAVADRRSWAQGVERMLSTEIERTLQQLWAQIFSLDSVSIGVNDHFFRLGSDSITAMHIFFFKLVDFIYHFPSVMFLETRLLVVSHGETLLSAPHHSFSLAAAAPEVTMQNFGLTP